MHTLTQYRAEKNLIGRIVKAGKIWDNSIEGRISVSPGLMLGLQEGEG